MQVCVYVCPLQPLIMWPSILPAALKKNFLPVLALGALPCLVEGGVIALITALYLRLKWQWAIMIG